MVYYSICFIIKVLRVKPSVMHSEALLEASSQTGADERLFILYRTSVFMALYKTSSERLLGFFSS